ncbi:MAG: choice-of-anchor J domain-containing protein, partial [Ferruginibacter sp.]
MHQNFTKLNPSFFRSGLVLMFALLFAFSNTMGQTYTNGNLSTGDTAANGTVAQAGYTYSQLQTGANSIGFNASVASNLSIADDFTVPAGQAWTVTNMMFYAYSTDYAQATSPFNTIRIRIYNSDPSVGAPTPIFGDLTTNRFVSSADAKIYRIGATPDVRRKIWSITASTPIQLGPGTYWVEFQLGTIAGVTSNFMPPSTIRGALTLPGYNALSHDNAANTWVPLVDGAARMDMPFKVNYTSCTSPTITITSSGGCSPATLTASGASTYTWSPAAGLNTTTGATVTATPVGTTTYTVTGTAAGCVGTASVTITNPFTSAVLTGIAPEEILLNESFNDSLPAGWLSINNSDVVGTNVAWTRGNPAAFPSHSGAPNAYILANFQMTAGTVIST